MNTAICDVHGQRERREAVRRLLVKYTACNFDSDGTWAGAFPMPSPLRERFWYAQAFLGGIEQDPDLIRLGNRVVQTAELEH